MLQSKEKIQQAMNKTLSKYQDGEIHVHVLMVDQYHSPTSYTHPSVCLSVHPTSEQACRH